MNLFPSEEGMFSFSMRMALENEKLMHECSPEHLCMEKETYEEEKQRRVKMEVNLARNKEVPKA